MIKQINSVNNDLIKNIVSLQQKKHIVASELCFLEGEKLVNEFLNNSVTSILHVLATKDKVSNYQNLNNNISVYEISDVVANKISDTRTNQGVFAVAKLPMRKGFDKNKNFLVLYKMQDPTNLGAIVRSALAFNFNQIILVDSTYPYTSKAIRTSMGYSLMPNYTHCSENEFEQFVNMHDLKMICADMNGDEISLLTSVKAPFGVLLGSEGQGVPQNIKDLCFKTVSINMGNGVESLNVSSSGAIIMYYLNNIK